jgi:uncharacterized membrane protein YcaP (DUF421 family)
MLHVDWSQVFSFTVSPLELFVRGTLTYLFLFALFRFFVRRDTGGLGISDLLVLVIIADAAQNAMAGEYKSVSDGAVLILTILGWSFLLNYLSMKSRFFRRLVLPQPICLIENGIKQKQNMRRQLISEEELGEMLREHEIDDISEVRRAYLEPDGQFTVLRKKKHEDSHPPKRDRIF